MPSEARLTPEQEARWNETIEMWKVLIDPPDMDREMVLAVDAELRYLRAELAVWKLTNFEEDQRHAQELKELRAELVERKAEASRLTLLEVERAPKLDRLAAALVAGQAREAALRQALEWIVSHDRWVRDNPSSPLDLDYWSDTIGKPALERSSPTPDALGRVARASVALEVTQRIPIDAGDTESIVYGSSLLSAAWDEWRAAVDELRAVAPWWGEPRGGDDTPASPGGD